MLLCSIPVFWFIYLTLSIAYIYHFCIMVRCSRHGLETPREHEAAPAPQPWKAEGPPQKQSIHWGVQCNKGSPRERHRQGPRTSHRPTEGWAPSGGLRAYLRLEGRGCSGKRRLNSASISRASAGRPCTLSSSIRASHFSGGSFSNPCQTGGGSCSTGLDARAPATGATSRASARGGATRGSPGAAGALAILPGVIASSAESTARSSRPDDGADRLGSGNGLPAGAVSAPAPDGAGAAASCRKRAAGSPLAASPSARDSRRTLEAAAGAGPAALFAPAGGVLGAGTAD